MREAILWYICVCVCFFNVSPTSTAKRQPIWDSLAPIMSTNANKGIVPQPHSLTNQQHTRNHYSQPFPTNIYPSLITGKYTPTFKRFLYGARADHSQSAAALRGCYIFLHMFPFFFFNFVFILVAKFPALPFASNLGEGGGWGGVNNLQSCADFRII